MLTVRLTSLRSPWLDVMHRPPPPRDFSLDEPSAMIERVTLHRHEIVVPTGCVGPEHWRTPRLSDPYFTAWHGRVAWDAVERVLYVDPGSYQAPTNAQAAKIVAWVEANERS